MLKVRDLLRFRIQSVPILVGLIMLLVLVQRARQNWTTLSNFTIDRKPLDLLAVRNGVWFVDKPPVTNKQEVKEAIERIVAGAHRNTVFLLGESRFTPTIVVQPKRRFSDAEIAKVKQLWADSVNYKKIYSKEGLVFTFNRKVYQAIAAPVKINADSYDLLAFTSISRTVEKAYLQSLIELSTLLFGVSVIILVILTAVARSAIAHSRSIYTRQKSEIKWWWPLEIQWSAENYNTFLAAENIYKVQIDQSTSGQMIVRSKGMNEGVIYNPNKALSNISGYTQQELDGQPLNLIVPKEYHKYHFGLGAYDEELGRRVGMAAYAQGCPFHGRHASRIVGRDRTVDLLRKNGTIRKVVLGVFYVGKNDAEDDEWVGVITDVTELTDAIAKANEAKNENLQLIQAWSHDLKGQAKGVFDELSSLKRLQPAFDTEAQKLCFETALARAELTFDLIQNTRDLGDLELKLKPTSTKEILRRISLIHGDKNIKYKWPDDEYFIEMDCDRFISMGFNNLIENAFKYSPGSNPEVIVGLKIDKGFAKFFVQDFGLGMDEAGQAKVMAGNFGSRVRLNPQIEGTGQGIFSAKRVFKAHNAELSLKSQLGQGSIFVVKIRLGGSS